MPGRLAGHGDTGDPWAAARSAAQSSALPRSQALHPNVRRAKTFESWSHTTTICFTSARSIATIALTNGTCSRSRASLALRFRSPRETPIALPMNVLLLRWDTKPSKRIRRTFATPGKTRRTCFYAGGLNGLTQHFLDSRRSRWRVSTGNGCHL